MEYETIKKLDSLVDADGGNHKDNFYDRRYSKCRNHIVEFYSRNQTWKTKHRKGMSKE